MIFRIAFLALISALFADGSIAQSCDLSQAVAVAEKLTGLSKMHPVKCQMLGKKEFNVLLSTGMLRYKTNDQLVVEEVIHKLYGITPFHFPYKRCAYQSLSDEVPAFYDEVTNTINIGSANPPFHTLVHESVHALQDQHYDLERFAKDNFHTLDEQLSALSIIEGQAVAAESTVINAPADSPEVSPDENCKLPEKLDLEFAFPYEFGSLLVKKINDNKTVQNLLRKPFQTSASIMNPKFKQKKTIRRDTIPSKLCNLTSGCLPLYQEDSLGQYFFSLVFSRPEKDLSGLPAALGWSDDVLLWARNENGTKAILENQILLNSQKDVDEFWHALIQTFEEVYETTLHESSQRIHFTSREIEISIKKEDLNITITWALNPQDLIQE